MTMKRQICIWTPMGCMYVTHDGVTVLGVALVRNVAVPLCGEDASPLAQEIVKEFSEYFAGKRRVFDLPVSFEHATDFQRAVWNELRTIPYGTTVTYGHVATAIGRPRAARAVGGACNRNPLLVLVPCHRVVGAGGSLTGFAAGLDIKMALLEIEA